MIIDMKEIDRIANISDYNARVLAAAVYYAEIGLPVVPIRPGKKILPESSKGGINYASASRNYRVVRAWFGPGGPYEGYNVGISCGRVDGVFCVDLDCRPDIGVDGVRSFKKVAPSYIYNGPEQVTPSNGRHYIFRWAEGLSSSTGKIGPGIDTRGGTSTVCKSHFVAFPSIVGGRQYRWSRGGAIPECPEWLHQGFFAQWRAPVALGGDDAAPAAVGRGSENVTPIDVETKYSITQINSMLSYVDLNAKDDLGGWVIGYEDWLRVGMAIHSQHPNDEGLALWEEWSSTGTRYVVGETTSRWRHFTKEGGVRIGTLIALAKTGGMSRPSNIGTLTVHAATKDVIGVDEIVEEMNKTFAIVPVGGNIAILQEVENKEVTQVSITYRLLNRQSFGMLMQNKSSMVLDPHAGKFKNITHDEIWLAHENRREYPGGIDMMPGKPRDFDGKYNTWAGFAKEPKKGDWSLFNDHLLHVICGGNHEYHQWVLDWMADVLQDPGNPKGSAIVMAGVEGCGKGTVCEFLGSILGPHYKHVVNEEHLVGRFNSHLSDAVLIFADEVTFGGNRKVAGVLKSLVTEPQIMCERKGIDAVRHTNCARLVVASNEDWFIPAGPQSRRWFVLECAPHKANNRDYFEALYRQMRDEGGIEAFMYDMLERKITNNLRKAPETEAMWEQRERYAAANPVVEWWAAKVSSGNLGIPGYPEHFQTSEEWKPDYEVEWPSMVLKSDLFEDYISWSSIHKPRRRVMPNVFFKDLKRLGVGSGRKAPKEGRVRVCYIPKLEVATRAMEEVGIKFDDEE